jgi:hypothetical protein
MDLEKYCNSEFINIPAEDWKAILAYIGDSKERKLEITTQLAELAGRYPLPLPKVTQDEMIRDYELFVRERVSRVKVNTTVRGGPYKHPISEETWKWKWWGVAVADAFFKAVQLQASHRRYRSPAAAWGDMTGRRTAFNALVALKKSHVDEKMVLTGFKLRLHIAGNFLPTVAREIYDLYGGRRVLDFSAGYGGRFVGYWGSTAQHYVGIDPNTSCHPCYTALAEWLSQNYPRGKTWQFLCQPAEEVDYTQFGEIDLAFTSPPYFNLERYSQEPTQSWKRYKEIGQWKEQFLFKTIGKIAPIICPGGHIVVNICDSPSHDELRVCDDMCDYAASIGLEVLPAIRMLMTNRPGNSVQPGAARISEPIWVFRKPTRLVHGNQ